MILTASLVANLGLLIVFKYGDFIITNLNTIRSIWSHSDTTLPALNLLLPVGISFYTFQTISYTIDVYKRRINPETNLLRFALYVCFFPQLVAGPIERFSSLSPQLKGPFKLTEKNLSHGFRLILYGLFTKMVIADNIAPIVDDAYLNLTELNSLNLIFVAFLYAFQIYCDFLGYSTIAIGTARLFDIKLSANFQGPYFSQSLSDFWRKWHMTLSNWFRDYVYYPLGGNKNGKTKNIIALALVFIISGIWHGANWTFVIWGALNGVFIILEKVLDFDKKSKNLCLAFCRALIIFSLVTLLWIFFRSPDLSTALTYFSAIFENWQLPFRNPNLEIIILLTFFIGVDFTLRKSDFAAALDRLSWPYRWLTYFFLIFLLLGRAGTDLNPFIYFQF